MRKQHLYLIFSVISIICLFALAASCNMCGLSIANKTDGESSSLAEEIQSDGISGDTQAEEIQSDGISGDTQTEGHSGNEDEADVSVEEESNHNPVITNVVAGEEELNLSDEFRILTGENTNFLVQAEDQDDDELFYSVYDSNENNLETVRIDNNTAGFGWAAPSDPGLYEIYIEVSDGNGGEATETVRVTVNPWEVVEGDDEDAGVVGPSVSLRSLGADASISGQISEDRVVFIAANSSGTPAIYVGDTTNAMLVKGFLSFNISGITGENVLNSWLNLSGTRIGNPPSLMGIFSVNYTNYGNTLDGSDWGSSSSAIFSSSLSNTDFSFTNNALKNAVQDALDEGNQYFQVKLSTQNANGNNATDGFTFLLSNLSLEVEYN